MKLFTTKQIAELDKYTILNEPISDLHLMERASLQITNWIVKRYNTENKIVVFAGPGNNGGDGLAVARQLSNLDFICEVHLLNFGKDLKGSPAKNRDRLIEQNKVKLREIDSLEGFPEIYPDDIILDALFGSGLTRPLEGIAAELVQKINTLSNLVIAIDIPSGLMGEDNSNAANENIICADFTLTLQFPKISFLFAENERYVGNFEVLPIGLHPEGIKKTDTKYELTDANDVRKMIPGRSKFEHKGTLGHALLIAGSFGKMGAAVLASRACLRSGTGLLTAHVPRMGYSIIQTAVPEAMASVDQHDSMCTEYPDLDAFSAIAIGPGLDQKQNTCRALCSLLNEVKVPIVLDADAINILSKNQDWLVKLPELSVLTPHPGEFRRLVGESQNSYDRIQKQIQFSKEYKVVVVLKGAYTTVSTPEGNIYFNPTGNPGMATAGSGDALTGVILGLMAQGINPVEAAISGVYLHGYAGDLAANEISQNSLIAGDIIQKLGNAFLALKADSTK